MMGELRIPFFTLFLLAFRKTPIWPDFFSGMFLPYPQEKEGAF